MMKYGKKLGLALLIVVPVFGIAFVSGATLTNAAPKSTPVPTGKVSVDKDSAKNDKAKEKAKEIALKKTDGGTVTKCVFDYEDGRQVYEIEIVNENIEYEMDVDAQDGTITDYDTERIRTSSSKINHQNDDDRHHDWDDDHDDWDDDHDDWDDDHDDRDDDHDDWDDDWLDVVFDYDD